jgi:iron(III) transport system ATP-binding protein
VTTIFVTHDQEEANTTADRIAVINDGIVQQIGSPMELYDRPANLFVANFLGVANVVEGTMAEQNGNMVFHSSDGAVVVPVTEGGRGAGSIVFRPQNLKILPPEARPEPGTAQLAGLVEHKEFLGGVVRYRVAVGGQFVLVDAPHQRGETALSEGTPVTLCLNTDQVIGLRH